MRVFLPVSLAGLVLAAGCGNGTTTSPSSTSSNSTTSPSTVTFASQLAVGGSTTRSFTMSTAGTVKLTLSTLGNGSMVAGIGIGVGATGSPCSLAQSVVTGPDSSPQIVTSADAGAYCVEIYDTGTLFEDTPFSLTVEHP